MPEWTNLSRNTITVDCACLPPRFWTDVFTFTTIKCLQNVSVHVPLTCPARDSASEAYGPWDWEGGSYSSQNVVQIAIFGHKAGNIWQTTWFSGTQWRKYSGKRLQSLMILVPYACRSEIVLLNFSLHARRTTWSRVPGRKIESAWFRQNRMGTIKSTLPL